MTDLDQPALLDEALKKSGLIWVGPTAADARAMWHVWEGGSIYLLCGDGEQSQPVEIGQPAVVIVRSKDKGVRLATASASVESLAPGEEWDRIVAIMATKRLNLPDGDAAPARWAAANIILKLTPAAELLESPGRYDAASQSATPRATDAGTKVPHPFHIFGRGRSKRR